MARAKCTTAELIKCFIEKLNEMPLTYPVGTWGKKASEMACELYYGAGRKGTAEKYAHEIYKAMMSHPQGTVCKEFAAEWVGGIVETECRDFDKYRKAR